MWWSLRAQAPRLFMARYTAMSTRMPPNRTSSCRPHGLFICRHRHRVWSIRLLPHGWCTTQRPRRCCTGHLFMSVLSIGLHHSGVQNTLSKWARAGTVKLGMGENAERVSVAMVVTNANASHGVVKRSDLTPKFTAFGAAPSRHAESRHQSASKRPAPIAPAVAPDHSDPPPRWCR